MGFRYSGHETFPCRYAWLPKAFAAIDADHEAFGDEEKAMICLWQARNYAMNTLHLAWPQRNLHELPRWQDLLVEQRKYQQVAYPQAFARSFNGRVMRVYLNWREHIRYHNNRPYTGEVTRTFQAVTWLLGQYRHL
jgi:hypothetical protein